MALAFCFGTLLSRQTCAQNPEWITLDERMACMSRADLESSIEKDLGSVEVPTGLSVEILGPGEGFLLNDGARIVAERRFDSLPTDCDAQLRMLSVVIAMAIEHHVATSGNQPDESEGRESEPESSPVVREVQQTPPAPRVEASVESSVRERKSKPGRTRSPVDDPFAVRVAGGASYSYGIMPVAAPFWTAEAGVMLRGGWFIGGGFLSSERMRIAFEVPEEEADGILVPEEAFTKALVQLMGGTLLGCYEPAFEKGRLGVCAGVAAGRFHARGVEGFDPNPGEAVPWLAALGRFIGRTPARGPFGMSLSLDIFTHFLRPGVELVGEGSAKSPRDSPPVGGAIGLGTFFVIQ